MRYLLPFSLICWLSGCLPTFGQTRRPPPASDNAAWIDSVQRLSLPQQVAAVHLRALRDTLLAPFQPAMDRVVLSATAHPPVPSPKLPVTVKTGFALLYVVDKQVFFRNDAATIRTLKGC